MRRPLMGLQSHQDNYAKNINNLLAVMAVITIKYFQEIYGVNISRKYMARKKDKQIRNKIKMEVRGGANMAEDGDEARK